MNHIADDGVVEREGVTYAHWQELYHLALVEPDTAKLRQRVQAAEAVIQERLAEISDDPNHGPERRAIQDALSSLYVLKAEMK
jgi:hypothetical protein